MEKDLTQEYWNQRYKKGETGWDIGAVSTPLKSFFDQLKSKEISILIPGCGNAYEAAYLLETGFTNVTLIDISPLVTAEVSERLRKYLHKQLRIVTGDFFDLEGKFDLIIEQTFLCALDPFYRGRYAQKVKALLKPGGKLTGVLFNRDFVGGPPFSGSIQEYRQLFSPHFEQVKIEPCYNSIPPRSESEAFIMAQ